MNVNAGDGDLSSSQDVQVIEIDKKDGCTVMNYKFFANLHLKYEKRKYCEEIEFLKQMGGVGNILKTLETGINNGINLSAA